MQQWVSLLDFLKKCNGKYLVHLMSDFVELKGVEGILENII